MHSHAPYPAAAAAPSCRTAAARESGGIIVRPSRGARINAEWRNPPGGIVPRLRQAARPIGAPVTTMRTTTLLLIGALVALAAIGAVAAQTASSSGSASDSSTTTAAVLPAGAPAHAGHHCPLHDAG